MTGIACNNCGQALRPTATVCWRCQAPNANYRPPNKALRFAILGSVAGVAFVLFLIAALAASQNAKRDAAMSAGSASTQAPEAASSVARGAQNMCTEMAEYAQKTQGLEHDPQLCVCIGEQAASDAKALGLPDTEETGSQLYLTRLERLSSNCGA